MAKGPARLEYNETARVGVVRHTTVIVHVLKANMAQQRSKRFSKLLGLVMDLLEKLSVPRNFLIKKSLKMC